MNNNKKDIIGQLYDYTLLYYVQKKHIIQLTIMQLFNT